MRADQLRSAAETIAELLKKSDLLNSIRQHRDARDDRQRQTTAARLTQSAKILLAGSRGFAEAEKRVCALLHLDKLSSLDYWQALLNNSGDRKAQEAELVQLYSRTMFASSHLPSLLGIVSTHVSLPAAINRKAGENTLVLRLNDAGEKAADPDRIARAIDGIDMIYAASVGLSRRQAMDLEIREISGHPEKLMVFLGDDEGITALCTVLDSIPEALDHFRDDEQLDLVEVVNSLPVFKDLATLADTGRYSSLELRDINDTMHQGIMLALESGVVVHEMPPPLDPENGVTTLSKKAGENQHYPVDSPSGFASQAEARYGDNGTAPNYANTATDQYRGDPDAARHNPDAYSEQNNFGQNNFGQQNAGQRNHAEQPGRGFDSTAPANSQSRSAGAAGEDESDEYYQQYLKERERLRDGQSAPRQQKRKEQKSSGLSGLFKGLTRSRNK